MVAKGKQSFAKEEAVGATGTGDIPVAVAVPVPDAVPVPKYYFTTRRIGPSPLIYASRASEVQLPHRLGATLAQFVDWIVSGATFDDISPSHCSCPCCPYSRGDLQMQRSLCLQRLVELHNTAGLD